MKKGSNDQILIKHMDFVWDRESCSVKIFVVFAEPVARKRIFEVCQKEGGGCIFIQTFDADITHELASGALQSILECGAKEGNEKFSKGICDPVLDAIVKSKMINAKSMSTAAFDEKTAAVIKYSIEGIDHKMDLCNDGVAGIDTKIEKVLQNVTENSALETMLLEDVLHSRFVAQQQVIKCHSVAAEKGHITRIVNKRNVTIAELEDQIDEFKAAKVLQQERYGHIKKILAGKNSTIAAINSAMTAKDATIAAINVALAAKDDIIISLKEKTTKLEDFADKDAEKTEKIARLEALLAAKDATIAEIRRTNLDAKIAAEDRRRVALQNNDDDTNE